MTDHGAELMAPHLTFAFEVRVDVEDAVRIGAHGEHDVLWHVAITGGTVSGPRLDGEVLGGGGDWFRDRDGTVTLDARYLLRASDGAVIDIVNRGFWHASPEVKPGWTLANKSTSASTTTGPHRCSRRTRRSTAG